MIFETLYLELERGTIIEVTLLDCVANMWKMDKETTKALSKFGKLIYKEKTEA